MSRPSFCQYISHSSYKNKKQKPTSLHFSAIPSDCQAIAVKGGSVFHFKRNRTRHLQLSHYAQTYVPLPTDISFTMPKHMFRHSETVYRIVFEYIRLRSNCSLSANRRRFLSPPASHTLRHKAIFVLTTLFEEISNKFHFRWKTIIFRLVLQEHILALLSL